MKIFYTTAFLVLLAANIFLIFKNRKTEEQYQLSAEKTGNYLQLYHNKLLLQVKNGNPIDLTADSAVYDLNGSHALGAVIDNEKLIFRFTGLNCNTCIEHEIPALKEIAGKIGEDNVIILASYDHPSTLKIMLDKYKLNFQVFNISMQSLSRNKIESLNLPYFFTLGKSLIGNNSFIPEKMLPSLTKDYLNLIAENYQRK